MSVCKGGVVEACVCVLECVLVSVDRNRLCLLSTGSSGATECVSKSFLPASVKTAN